MRKKLIVIFLILFMLVIPSLGFAYFKLQIIPDRVNHFLNLAKEAEEKGDPALAEKHAKEAIKLNNKLGEAYFILAKTGKSTGSMLRDEELQNLKTAKELGVDDIKLYNALSIAELENRNFVTAKENIKIALIKDHKNFEAKYLQSFYTLYVDQNAKKAIEEARSLVAEYPQNPPAIRLLAIALYYGDNKKEALEIINKSINDHPSYCLNYVAKAELEKETNLKQAYALLDEAEKIASKSLAFSKENPIDNYCLASIYSKRGDLAIIENKKELAKAFYSQAMNVSIPSGFMSDTFRLSAIKYK